MQDYASLVFLILKFLVSHLVTPTSPSKLGPSQTSHQLNPALSLLAESEHDLHDLVDDLHAASSRFGLLLTLKLKYSVVARISEK